MSQSSTVSLDNQLSKGFILQVKVFIANEDVDHFMSLFKPVYDVVFAEKECVFFVVGMDQQVQEENGKKVTCISWTEGWSESAEWFMSVQMNQDYYGPYLKATEILYVRPREVTILSASTGMNNFKIPNVQA